MAMTLVIFSQVHATIHLGDLLTVAVKRQRRNSILCKKAAASNAPFTGLTPPRMIDRWVHIGVKPILVRR
ncbi:MAG: hypothetical protein ABS22_06290 [SAR92 bacterium BACL16 MAG-120322-bin99]|nr:MAG: hypothetical protein ABS22_06290 [SAR92 bacterium BACL16 MAG-120322-bin99]